MAYGSMVWVRRLSFAAVLIIAAIAPGQAAQSSPGDCGGHRCQRAGLLLWSHELPGQWMVQNGLLGTTPAQGQVYAALGGEIAAVGMGLTVYAYGAGTGVPLWTTALAGFPAGAAIVSVRVWPGVVTVGVDPPLTAGTGSAHNRPQREEIVLRADTGQQLRAFPAAPFGGAVAANSASTVVVGERSLTQYSNHSGRVIWSRPTGARPQTWQVDGSHIYVSVSSGGYLGTSPVTGLRRIDLQTGAERLIHSPGGAFQGTLSLAFDGVVLFTGGHGVTAYSGASGATLWGRTGALPESVDVVDHRLYLLDGNVLLGVDPWTGTELARVFGAAAVASAGLYGVREGIVLGIDHGALGKAWGYDAAAGRVVWTSAPLPWPHYFVDLSGIGGSTSPSRDSFILATCTQLGAQLTAGLQRCAKPELVALSR